MPRFVALLRGVNVGTARRVPMADWRTQLTALGYTGVATVLNSGNAVFDAPGRRMAQAHAQRIQAALRDGLQVQAPVIVKSATDLAEAMAQNPLLEVADEPSRLLLAFAADDAALLALSELAPLARPPERLQVGRYAAYLWCAHGILDSAVGKALLGKAGRAVTTRNWATVQKIAAALSG